MYIDIVSKEFSAWPCHKTNSMPVASATLKKDVLMATHAVVNKISFPNLEPSFNISLC